MNNKSTRKTTKTSILNMTVPGKAHFTNFYEFNLHEDPVAFMRHVATMPELDYICVKASPNYHSYIADVPCGFDIETTTIKTQETVKKTNKDGSVTEKVIFPTVNGYMYIWQFTFGDMVVYGRNWAEFLFCINTIQQRYPELGVEEVATPYFTKGGSARVRHTKTARSVIMWIANAGFEFQYISKLKFNGKPIINGVFADGARSPLKVDISTTNRPSAFVVYDALRVGSLSLKSLAKDYCTTQKAVGDLDYSKPRNSMTTLTDTEMGYCRNDVVILNEWGRYYLDAYVKQCKFAPMTQTGIVREAIRQEFKRTKFDPFELRSMFPDNVCDYVRIREMLYRGGRTGSNVYLTGQEIENVCGKDFTSSYPAVMLQEKFPMQKFKDVNADLSQIKTRDDFNKFIEQFKGTDTCFYIKAKFKNIHVTTPHAVESIAKTEEFYQNNQNKIVTREQCTIVEDNGKIRSAGYMTVMLTDLDYDVYNRFYTWTEMEVYEFKTSVYAFLPEYITNVIKHFYKMKATLKRSGLDGTVEYVLAKAMVNACYGLMVQKINFDSYGFDIEKGWFKTELEYDQMQEKYMKEVGLGVYAFNKDGSTPSKVKYLMSPFQGVWVTSWARYRLYEAIEATSEDCIYTDTDSVYYRNHDAHEDWFTDWNDKITDMNKSLFGADFNDLGDLGTFDPVVIKGVDDNGKKVKSEFYTFKTLGAKRYFKFDKFGNCEQTVAGLPKHALLDSYEEKYKGMERHELCKIIMNEFKSGLLLDMSVSDKLTSRYNDQRHSDTVVDEAGNSEVMTSESSIALYEIPFELKVDDYYKALVLHLAGVVM